MSPTIAELERQLIETETVAANAVAEMDRKLAAARQMLAAVVIAAGGDVRVGQLDLIRSRDCAMSVGEDQTTGGKRIKVYNAPPLSDDEIDSRR